MHAEKMAMIGRLAANMAHEIKNPLAGILWNLHNLERRLLPDSPVARGRMRAAGLGDETVERLGRFLEEQKIPHYVSVIRECGLRADGIVKTLGDFSSRGEKQVDVPARTLVESTLMLARAAFDLDKRFDFRDIQVAVEVDDSIPPVHCNAQRIEQVLLNLVNNAAQALVLRRRDDGGFEPRIACRARRVGDHVRFEIEDNGPGIPAGTREHIFEPFFTTKDVGEGTGLGLSISYLIVTEGHGGQMWVEDGAWGGARFVVELEIRHESEDQAEERVRA
jgi:signal transduction histidine kinase